MTHFIQAHIKIFIAAIIIIVIAVLLIVVLMLSRSTGTNNVNPVENESQYAFLKDDNNSEQDKYVMLLGKISAENFGNYSQYDTRNLLDLSNQSTEPFKIIVQKSIDSITPNYKYELVVDENSIEIKNINQTRSIVSMNGNQTINSSSKNVEIKVDFVKENSFWLVNGIEIK